jgi:hypothetical protein
VYGPETLEGASFSSEETRAAAGAFDVACATLRLNQGDPRAHAVAQIILNLVLHRQPNDLSDSRELARRALVILRFRRTISRNAVPPEWAREDGSLNGAPAGQPPVLAKLMRDIELQTTPPR